MSYSTFEITGNTVTFKRGMYKGIAHTKGEQRYKNMETEVYYTSDEFLDSGGDGEYGDDLIDVGEEW